MAIEIGQMIIKSTVLPKEAAVNRGNRGVATQIDHEGLKQDILAECREMVMQLLSDQKER